MSTTVNSAPTVPAPSIEGFDVSAFPTFARYDSEDRREVIMVHEIGLMNGETAYKVELWTGEPYGEKEYTDAAMALDPGQIPAVVTRLRGDGR